MKTKNSPVRALLENDQHNTDQVFKLLGSKADLPDEVDKLYGALGSALHATKVPEVFDAAVLYARCRTHLLLGATSLFRLHSGQMLAETRSAVEAAGIAREIKSDAESRRIYLADDGEDNDARQALKVRFKPGRIFPKSCQLAARLFPYWDLGSQLLHTNMLTLRRHLQQSLGEGSSSRTFTIQDIDRDRPQDVQRFLAWMCEAHVTILELADLVFPEVETELVEFRKDREYIAGRTARIHAEVLAAEGG